ncbi:MAG: hemerythrin domain-containing protein [Bacteriovoracaceae bacterium]|nr:hemerythrin domain-containing protein [Bacteriovoracaceae bacterium]
MDIYQKIIDDHHNIREAIEELIETDNSQVEKRMRLLKELEHMFVAHTSSEEQTLYQALADTSDREAKAQIKKSRKEHNLAQHKMDSMKNTPLDSDLFLKSLEEFKTIVEEHFDEEEDELFDLAQDLLSSDEEHLIEEELEDLEDNVWSQPQY